MLKFDDLPGFSEAAERERLIRAAAFHPILERIGRFKVLPMTLDHYSALRLAWSPFIPPYTHRPTPLDLAQFLWVVSPDYSAEDKKRRAKFLRSCRCFHFERHRPRFFVRQWRNRIRLFRETVKSAREYVEEALMDCPPGERIAGYQPQYLAPTAFYCGVFAREYGWSDEYTMNRPLKRVFQGINEIKMHHTKPGKSQLFNPLSGRVVSDYLKAVNEKN